MSISEIKNPYIRRIAVVVCVPFLLIAYFFAAWAASFLDAWDDVRVAWRGE